jgi:hypothetical protein
MTWINAKDREALEKLYALYKRTTFNGEADRAQDAIVKLLSKYGLQWDDLQGVIDPCVLDLIDELIDLYIWMPPRERIVVALWILHAHVFKQFNVTPRLAILSLDYESGKTTLMALIQHLVPRIDTIAGWIANADDKPTRFLDPTQAALYQAIESGATTLIIDEVDNLGLKHNGKLRTILNANRIGEGIARGSTPKKGGQLLGPKLWYPFIPIVVGAVGRLPKALTTRSHVINMKPIPPHIRKKDLNEKDEEFLAMANAVYDAIVGWAGNIVLEQEPVMELSNRYRDNWRPFVAIADSMGRGEKVRNLARAMTGGPREYSETMQMRMDTRRIFNELKVDRIERKVLLEKLHELDAWNEWGRPSPLKNHEFSSILREIGVPPPHIVQRKGGRKERGKPGWGWYRSDFEGAWKDCPEEELKTLSGVNGGQ